MKEEEKEEIKRDIDKRLLSGRESEYVVSFKHRFLTYLALPLFVLFITGWVIVSWTVKVPERSELEVELFYSPTSGNWQFSLDEPTVAQLKSELALITESYLSLPDGKTITLDLTDDTFPPIIESVPNDWDRSQVYAASLITYVEKDRFLVKLWDELGKGIQLKRPPSEEEGPKN